MSTSTARKAWPQDIRTTSRRPSRLPPRWGSWFGAETSFSIATYIHSPERLAKRNMHVRWGMPTAKF